MGKGHENTKVLTTLEEHLNDIDITYRQNKPNKHRPLQKTKVDSRRVNNKTNYNVL